MSRLNPPTRENALSASDVAQRQFDTYRRLYREAPSLSDTFQVNSAAFEYCRRVNHFSLIVPYVIDHRILVERIFMNEGILWTLLGEGLRQDAQEDFIVAANEIAQEALSGVQLADIVPIAFLSHVFQCEGREWTHKGIAFMGRIRGRDTDQKLRSVKRTRAQLVDIDTPLGSVTPLQNAKVLGVAQECLASKERGRIPFHDNEISRNELYRNRYQFHDTVVKPVMRAASEYVCEQSLGDVAKVIDEAIREVSPHSIIDVACGENGLCNALAERGDIPIVVGNDVAWSQIELIRKTRSLPHPASSLLYTNHDATDLPFADKTFSVAICKNVLHHMASAEAVRELIGECIRIAHRAIIIEVADPVAEHLGSRIMRHYYIDFLRDGAVKFYSRRELEEFTDKDELRERFLMSTVQGVYQFAVFDS